MLGLTSKDAAAQGDNVAWLLSQCWEAAQNIAVGSVTPAVCVSSAGLTTENSQAQRE